MSTDSNGGEDRQVPVTPSMRYATIVADPPWMVNTGPSWGTPNTGVKNSRSHGLTYEVMTVGAIERLPVDMLADANAHLYLWTINRYVEAAFDVVRAWGFNPSTLLTWCKPRKGKGLGGAYALTTEFCLFARRGTLAYRERWPESAFHWPRHQHSRKPDGFLDIVESVSPGPYLELFARRNRLGWDTWGNQSLEHVEMAV